MALEEFLDGREIKKSDNVRDLLCTITDLIDDELAELEDDAESGVYSNFEMVEKIRELRKRIY